MKLSLAFGWIEKIKIIKGKLLFASSWNKQLKRILLYMSLFQQGFLKIEVIKKQQVERQEIFLINYVMEKLSYNANLLC